MYLYGQTAFQPPRSEELFYLPDRLITFLTFQSPSSSDQQFQFVCFFFNFSTFLLFRFSAFPLQSAFQLFCFSASQLFGFWLFSFSASLLFSFSAFPASLLFSFSASRLFSAFQLLSQQTALALNPSASQPSQLLKSAIYLLVFCLHYLEI